MIRRALPLILVAGCRVTVPDAIEDYRDAMRALSRDRREGERRLARALPLLYEDFSSNDTVRDLGARTMAARCLIELGEDASAARIIESAASEFETFPDVEGDPVGLHLMRAARLRAEFDRETDPEIRLDLIDRAVAQVLSAEDRGRSDPVLRFARLIRVGLMRLQAEACLANVGRGGPDMRLRAANLAKAALKLCHEHFEETLREERRKLEALQYGD